MTSIPTCVHVSAALRYQRPGVDAGTRGTLSKTLEVEIGRPRLTADIVKTGRTHLMDAMPVTLGQELLAAGARR